VPHEPREPQEPHGARAGAPPRAGARAGWAAVINPILQQTVPACIQYGVNLMQLRALHDRRAGTASQGPGQGPAQGPAALRAQPPGAGGAPAEPGGAGGPVDPAALAAQLQRAAGEYNEVLQRGRSAVAALEATVTPGQSRRCRPRVCLARPTSAGGAGRARRRTCAAWCQRMEAGSVTVLQAFLARGAARAGAARAAVPVCFCASCCSSACACVSRLFFHLLSLLSSGRQRVGQIFDVCTSTLPLRLACK